MPISSSSVIHFTRTKSALKGILADNFRIKYCLETFRAETKDLPYASPMVSFCDIPLSQVKEHIGKYGSYGIGLTKEWATRQRLSPVQYVATGSLHAASLKVLINTTIPKNPTAWKDLTDVQQAAIDMMRYLKNYQGDLTRNGKTIKNYRYYDEREWRYVPSFDPIFPMLVPGGDYKTPSQKQAVNKLISDIRLTFEPSDIKYIIIRSDEEISEFVETIRGTKGNSTSLSDTERLTTRIITKEQIESDL